MSKCWLPTPRGISPGSLARRHKNQQHRLKAPGSFDSGDGREPPALAGSRGSRGNLVARFPRSLRSLGPVLTSSAVVERAGPFHSRPEAGRARRFLAAGRARRFLAAGRARRFLAAGRARRFLAAGRARRFLAAGRIVDPSHSRQPHASPADSLVRACRRLLANPSHDSGSRPPADPPFSRAVQAAASQRAPSAA